MTEMNWPIIIDAVKRRLRITSDNDFRNWREIERVLRTTIATAETMAKDETRRS